MLEVMVVEEEKGNGGWKGERCYFIDDFGVGGLTDAQHTKGLDYPIECAARLRM